MNLLLKKHASLGNYILMFYVEKKHKFIFRNADKYIKYFLSLLKKGSIFAFIKSTTYVRHKQTIHWNSFAD
ncbi:hypothetical protein CCAND93_680081 [Capnocytophaga canis]|uniref:Uncharacterized protein n=1 Tax=Capnocytophaga canis TaxID=1848903 RepID=A0A0B7IQE3_9FLAO|nr:hypothetical protein CCAND93_680081 [Capnocytophaga canis]